MSSSMEILARQVVGYHFCNLDNESSCTIPEFVHSIAAQLTQNPNMSHYHRLVSSTHQLHQILSYASCLADPSKAFIEGILEPLKLLRSQGKFPHQRSLLLVDGLCEAEYHRSDNGDTLSSFLKSHLDLFPNWLRVICTVRTNMLDIVKPFTFHRIRYSQSCPSGQCSSSSKLVHYMQISTLIDAIWLSISSADPN